MRVRENGKIRITISDKYKGKSSMMFGNTDKILSPKFSGEFNIRGVDIWIASYSGGVHRKYLFRHELMHALGFSHVADQKIHNTVMGRRRYASIEEYEARGKLFDHYTDLDKAAIRMMYQECLPEGLRMEDFGRELREYRRQDTTKTYLHPASN